MVQSRTVALSKDKIPSTRGDANLRTQREVRFSRNLGSNAPDLIANLVVSGTIPAIEELIANAYDADATRVDIQYRPDWNALVLSDNGSGMTSDKGLDAFYRLGDSPKLKEPISAAGRARIGKFGVATILLRSLCEEYKLITQQDGRKTMIHEKLEERVTADKPIVGKEIAGDEEVHGTQLLLRGLRFEEGDNFSIAELKRRIQWDLPLLPDFQVYVNGEQVKSKSIESATVFKIDTEGKNMGSVRGNFYLANRKAPMAGIHVYVHGRKIGDPKTFLKQGRITTRDQLVGIVYADGLENAILFDRGRFREDHPGVVELARTLTKAINAVDNYTRDTQERSLVHRVQSQRGRIIKKTLQQLVRAKVLGIDKRTSIEFSDEVDPEMPGRYSSDTKAIYLNNHHPSLVPSGLTTLPRYEQAILGAVIDAIALEETEGEKNHLKAFLRRRGELWDQLNATSTEEKPKGEIHPMVMYQLADLGRITGRGIGPMRYLAEGQVFPVDEEGVLGREFLEAQKLMHGFITLYEVVHNKLAEHQDGSGQSPNNVMVVLDRFHNTLKRAGEATVPFLYEAGKEPARPCYVVEQTCVDRVYSLLRSPAVDMRRTGADPERVFIEAFNQAYTIPELAKSLGLTIDAVTSTLGYAKKHGLNIAIDRKTPVRFRFGDFIRGLQAERKEAHDRSTES